MCTVLLRFAPDSAWPVCLGAVRDEFVGRAWDPPAYHWPAPSQGLIGGRDRLAGGTWLAVDPAAPAVAAVLNGVRLAAPHDGPRPSRGSLPLDLLNGAGLPADVTDFDGFHALLATPAGVTVWSWDGTALASVVLPPGDHVIVNDGVDAVTEPTVAHFLPLLRNTPSVWPGDGNTAREWADWVDLLAGDELDPTDPAALLVRHEVGDAVYASTSASLVALSRDGARYDFNATPTRRDGWSTVHLGRSS